MSQSMRRDNFFFRQTVTDLILVFLSIASVNKVLAHHTLTVWVLFPAGQFFLMKTLIVPWLLMCLIKARVAKSSVRKSDVLTRINIVGNSKGKIRSIKSEWSLALPFNQTLVCEFLHDIKIQLSILGKKAGH